MFEKKETTVKAVNWPEGTHLSGSRLNNNSISGVDDSHHPKIEIKTKIEKKKKNKKKNRIEKVMKERKKILRMESYTRIDLQMSLKK